MAILLKNYRQFWFSKNFLSIIVLIYALVLLIYLAIINYNLKRDDLIFSNGFVSEKHNLTKFREEVFFKKIIFKVFLSDQKEDYSLLLPYKQLPSVIKFESLDNCNINGFYIISVFLISLLIFIIPLEHETNYSIISRSIYMYANHFIYLSFVYVYMIMLSVITWAIMSLYGRVNFAEMITKCAAFNLNILLSLYLLNLHVLKQQEKQQKILINLIVFMPLLFMYNFLLVDDVLLFAGLLSIALYMYVDFEYYKDIDTNVTSGAILKFMKDNVVLSIFVNGIYAICGESGEGKTKLLENIYRGNGVLKYLNEGNFKKIQYFFKFYQGIRIYPFHFLTNYEHILLHSQMNRQTNIWYAIHLFKMFNINPNDYPCNERDNRLLWLILMSMNKHNILLLDNILIDLNEQDKKYIYYCLYYIRKRNIIIMATNELEYLDFMQCKLYVMHFGRLNPQREIEKQYFIHNRTEEMLPQTYRNAIAMGHPITNNLYINLPQVNNFSEFLIKWNTLYHEGDEIMIIPASLYTLYYSSVYQMDDLIERNRKSIEVADYKLSGRTIFKYEFYDSMRFFKENRWICIASVYLYLILYVVKYVFLNYGGIWIDYDLTSIIDYGVNIYTNQHLAIKSHRIFTVSTITPELLKTMKNSIAYDAITSTIYYKNANYYTLLLLYKYIVDENLKNANILLYTADDIIEVINQLQNYIFFVILCLVLRRRYIRIFNDIHFAFYEKFTSTVSGVLFDLSYMMIISFMTGNPICPNLIVNFFYIILAAFIRDDFYIRIAKVFVFLSINLSGCHGYVGIVQLLIFANLWIYYSYKWGKRNSFMHVINYTEIPRRKLIGVYATNCPDCIYTGMSKLVKMKNVGYFWGDNVARMNYMTVDEYLMRQKILNGITNETYNKSFNLLHLTKYKDCLLSDLSPGNLQGVFLLAFLFNSGNKDAVVVDLVKDKISPGLNSAIVKLLQIFSNKFTIFVNIEDFDNDIIICDSLLDIETSSVINNISNQSIVTIKIVEDKDYSNFIDGMKDLHYNCIKTTETKMIFISSLPTANQLREVMDLLLIFEISLVSLLYNPE